MGAFEWQIEDINIFNKSNFFPRLFVYVLLFFLHVFVPCALKMPLRGKFTPKKNGFTRERNGLVPLPHEPMSEMTHDDIRDVYVLF